MPQQVERSMENTSTSKLELSEEKDDTQTKYFEIVYSDSYNSFWK